jgi:Sulfatase
MEETALSRVLTGRLVLLFATMGLFGAFAQAQAQQKPNIILVVGDDVGYGDFGVYGGGEGRGMPTPNLDRLANEDTQNLGTVSCRTDDGDGAAKPPR